MDATDRNDPVFRAVVDALEVSLQEVFASVRSGLRGMDFYDRVDDGAVRDSIRLNLGLSAHALRTGGAPVPRELVATLDEVIAARIEIGVTTDQMIQGHNVVMRSVLQRLIALGDEHRLPERTTLDASQLLWTASQRVLQRATAMMGQRMITVALREQAHRSDFIRGLISHHLIGPELEAEVIAHRLDPRGSYRAVRIRVREGADADRVRRQVEETASLGRHRAVVAHVGRESAGVVPADATFSDALAWDAHIALGPSAPIAEMSPSFAVASRVLAWMERHRVLGVRDVPSLSWRLMVDPIGDVDAHLYERYLAPLARDSAARDVTVDSLRTYLAHDRNVARAAEDLVVHPNTLRHRLRRYTELTGVDPDSTEAIVGLSWALEGAHVVAQDNDGR